MQEMARRSFYPLWGRLPTWLKTAVFFLLAPKVIVGVAAVITDGHGQLLLLHHTYRTPPWNFPAGLVKRHEQPIAALARELHEELGLDARIGPLLDAGYDRRANLLTLFYRVTVVATPQVSAEVDRFRYAAVEELPRLWGWPVPPWLHDVLSSE